MTKHQQHKSNSKEAATDKTHNQQRDSHNIIQPSHAFSHFEQQQLPATMNNLFGFPGNLQQEEPRPIQPQQQLQLQHQQQQLQQQQQLGLQQQQLGLQQQLQLLQPPPPQPLPEAPEPTHLPTLPATAAGPPKKRKTFSFLPNDDADDNPAVDLLSLLESVLDELRDLVEFAENRGNFFLFVQGPHAEFVRQTLAAIAQRIESTKDDVEQATKIVSSSNMHRNNNNNNNSLNNLNNLFNNNNNNNNQINMNNLNNNNLNQIGNNFWMNNLKNDNPNLFASPAVPNRIQLDDLLPPTSPVPPLPTTTIPTTGTAAVTAAGAINTLAAKSLRRSLTPPNLTNNLTMANTSTPEEPTPLPTKRKRSNQTQSQQQRRQQQTPRQRKKQPPPQPQEPKVEEDILPYYPPPSNGKEYTKQESIDILSKMNRKDRNRTIVKWIYEKKVPIESSIQMNKLLRDARENKPINMEWRNPKTLPNSASDSASLIPQPANGVEYTKREAIEILLTIKTTRQRNKTITAWIAEKRIPVLNQGTVITALQQAQENPNNITDGWGRWGKGTTLAAQDKEQFFAVPSFPPPNNGKEYTKLEAINILSKMTNSRDRNKTIGIWIQERKVPITHPNTMQRILKEARSNLPMKSIHWRTDDTIPYAPPPTNGRQYAKQEMIDILAQLKARDRSRLISVWINENKITYKSPATVGNLVRKAINERKQANNSTTAGGNNATTTKTTPATVTGGSGAAQKRLNLHPAAANNRKDDDIDEASSLSASDKEDPVDILGA